jgi:hypothetical protein
MGPCLRRPKTNDRHDHMIQSQHSQHTVGRTAVAVVVLLCCAAAAVRRTAVRRQTQTQQAHWAHNGHKALCRKGRRHPCAAFDVRPSSRCSSSC